MTVATLELQQFLLIVTLYLKFMTFFIAQLQQLFGNANSFSKFLPHITLVTFYQNCNFISHNCYISHLQFFLRTATFS